MREVKKWLSELEEPYRTQALANFENNYLFGGHEGIKASDMVDALFSAFTWDESPEGFDYWDELVYELKTKTD